MNYAEHYNKKTTPQTEAIPGSNQIANSSGGFSFPVDDWVRLQRFQILGSVGGSYYATEKKLTRENADAVVKCIKLDGQRVVRETVEVSEQGRAPKNGPAIFVLALCTSEGDQHTKQAAYAAVNKVCRTGTHLFEFVSYCNTLRGWGSGLRKAVGRWYSTKTADQLAYQVAKYQQREGFSHRDVLRLAHVKNTDSSLASVLRWVIGGADQLGERKIKRGDKETTYSAVGELPKLIQAWEQAKKCEDKKEIVRLIHDSGLVRELVPTQFLTEACVWEALLEKMPLTALLRNLGNLSKNGVVVPFSKGTKRVVEELSNPVKSRVHPLAILLALKTYASGCGLKGKGTWTPVSAVVDALDSAFYKAFDNVQPTGKRMLLALDVSGSMTSPIAGTNITCREASAALALVTASTEPNYEVMGFSTTFVKLGITKGMRLQDAINKVSGLPFAGTDCSLPMLFAEKNKLDVDGFVVYTDSETYFNPTIHPCQALQQYRKSRGIAAKSAVVGMTSNNFTLADPQDAGMADFVGFDAALPTVLADFIGYNKPVEVASEVEEG